jgi:hypothetical protein
MYSSPELTMLVATEYQRSRVADADRYRLLQRALRSRRAGRRTAKHEARAGTLAPCAPAAV